ncbi:hypothetical protein MNBD_NITROSPINAE01-1530 [hydrothermal vent metagenome]|uniref:HDOD domain-containing protein n=1 Tax=hydrothermal vent metagenome TaxID=652676 RepID=A0A3B1C116_9ZZZZ
MLDKERKRIIIQKILDLPTLPTTLLKIIKIAENENSTAADLAEVISKDQSISSTVLKLVNSAFYGHMRQVSSIHHAIVILGFQTVKALSLGVSVFKSTPTKGKPAFDRNLFWIHSIGVATIAQCIMEKTPNQGNFDKDTVFLSGLLHDLGKVVFDNFFTDEYQGVAKTAMDEGRWIGAVEKESLEMDHSESGFYLAEKWQFPADVIAGIKHHHNLGSNPSDRMRMPALVNMADYCCRKMRLGSGGDMEEVPLNPVALKLWNITEDVLDEVIEEMEKSRDAIEEFTFVQQA